MIGEFVPLDRECANLPAATFHTCTAPDSVPTAKYFPSGDQSTHKARPVSQVAIVS
jgi:hypothetical protein